MIKLIKRLSVKNIKRPVSIWYMDSEKLMYRNESLLRISYSSPSDSGSTISDNNLDGEGEIVFYY